MRGSLSWQIVGVGKRARARLSRQPISSLTLRAAERLQSPREHGAKSSCRWTHVTGLRARWGELQSAQAQVNDMKLPYSIARQRDLGSELPRCAQILRRGGAKIHSRHGAISMPCRQEPTSLDLHSTQVSSCNLRPHGRSPFTHLCSPAQLEPSTQEPRLQRNARSWWRRRTRTSKFTCSSPPHGSRVRSLTTSPGTLCALQDKQKRASETGSLPVVVGSTPSGGGSAFLMRGILGHGLRGARPPRGW